MTSHSASDPTSAPAVSTQEDELLMRAVRRVRSLLLGMVFGLTFGAVLFLTTAILLLKGGTTVGPHLSLLGQFFPGYTVTWGGSILGFFYGAFVGFAMGWGIGWIYNTAVHWRQRRR